MKRVLYCSIGLLLLSSISPAMIVRLSLPELVQRSALIVRGTVLKTESYWGKRHYQPEVPIILTDVTVAVNDILLGGLTDEERVAPEQESAALGTVVVTVEGGVVGDLGVQVEDEPEFQTDEDVILMLSPRYPTGNRRVTNFANGKYTVQGGVVLETNETVTDFLAVLIQTIQNRKGSER